MACEGRAIIADAALTKRERRAGSVGAERPQGRMEQTPQKNMRRIAGLPSSGNRQRGQGAMRSAVGARTEWRYFVTVRQISLLFYRQQDWAIRRNDFGDRWLDQMRNLSTKSTSWRMRLFKKSHVILNRVD